MGVNLESLVSLYLDMFTLGKFRVFFVAVLCQPAFFASLKSSLQLKDLFTYVNIKIPKNFDVSSQGSQNMIVFDHFPIHKQMCF